MGGIQPGPLNAYLQDTFRNGAGDDGLLQRFQIIVWPDDPKQWCNVDRMPNKQAKERALMVFNRLASIDISQIGAEQGENGEIPSLRFTTDAQILFNEWRTKLEHRLLLNDDHPSIKAHLGKYRSLIPSIALLIYLADVGRGPVGIAAFQQACAWGDYLESHARRVYSTCIAADMLAAKTLLKHLKAGKLPNPFSMRDVYRNGWSGLTDPVDAKKAAVLLEDHNILRACEPQRTGGRPKEEWYLNPKVKGARHGGMA